MTAEFTRVSMPTVEHMIAADTGAPPPAPYLESAPRSFGTEPIPVERYVSAQFQRLEYDRLWSKV